MANLVPSLDQRIEVIKEVFSGIVVRLNGSSDPVNPPKLERFCNALRRLQRYRTEFLCDPVAKYVALSLRFVPRGYIRNSDFELGESRRKICKRVLSYAVLD